MASMKRELIYKRISVKKGKDVRIKLSLCFYNPREVYYALIKNRQVKKWLKYISNHYSPPKKKVLLIFPCSTLKPYHKSQSYRQLLETLSLLRERRDQVHLVAISEPFGLVPEEFFGKRTEWHDWKNDWYDCPGLFEWWCDQHGQPYSREYLDRSVEELATYVARFLKKAKKRRSYSKIIAFVRTYSSNLKRKHDHTHRRIIERAAASARVNVELLPDQRVISNIVRKSGRFAWDMYGVSHPIAQRFLIQRLRGILNEA